MVFLSVVRSGWWEHSGGSRHLEGEGRGRKLLRSNRETAFSQSVQKYLNISTTSWLGQYVPYMHPQWTSAVRIMVPTADNRQHPLQHGNEIWTRSAPAWKNYGRTHYMADQENNKIFPILCKINTHMLSKYSGEGKKKDSINPPILQHVFQSFSSNGDGQMLVSRLLQFSPWQTAVSLHTKWPREAFNMPCVPTEADPEQRFKCPVVWQAQEIIVRVGM